MVTKDTIKGEVSPTYNWKQSLQMHVESFFKNVIY